MPSKGGAGPYRKGAAHERLVKKAYEDAGWFVVRSPQSGSPIDLLAIKRRKIADGFTVQHVHHVQVKSSGYLRPAEKQAVIDLADKYGGLPVLAWVDHGHVHRRDLCTGGDLEWTAGSPLPQS